LKRDVRSDTAPPALSGRLQAMSSPASVVDWTLRDQLPEAGRPALGRYRRPLCRLDVGLGAPRYRLKEWCYTSCTTDDWFFALAVVQLGYAAQLFAYVVDRRTGQRRETERVVPLGGSLSFAPSSQWGVTRWRSRRTAVDVGHDGSHYLRVDLDLDGEHLHGELRMEPDDALALLFPLSVTRRAYTHKAAGMRTRGSLRWGARTLSLDGGLGALDWTRSVADRHTVWNWASFAGHTESGKRFGLNLSARVYDGDAGSLENVLWLDGRAEVLGGVRFIVPRRTTERWFVHSSDGSGEVDLEVLPWGERRAKLELGVLRSVFAQPYGLASGSVRGERVSGAFGVVEDHDSLW
jgi:hypothetical protein